MCAAPRAARSARTVAHPARTAAATRRSIATWTLFRWLELAGEQAQLVERAPGIGLGPAAPESTADGGSVAFGQVLEHVSLLVPDTAQGSRLLSAGMR